jgi:hypothetical protein
MGKGKNTGMLKEILGAKYISFFNQPTYSLLFP